MKRHIGVLSLLAAVVVVGSFFGGHVLASNGSRNGVAAAAVSLNSQTRGVVFDTAAVNSDGTIAKCFQCSTSNSFHIGTGEYQVEFKSSHLANDGWSRWVQVDTLSTGSINNVSCATADRSGDDKAIWINCFDGSGNPVDTSFFLFSAR